MRNAAHELAEQLTKWRTVPNGVTVMASRKAGDEPAETWRAHVRAASLLKEVDAYLDAVSKSGRSVAHFRRAYPLWASGIFAPDVNWREVRGGAVTVIEQHAIDLLFALGDMVDAYQVTVTISADQASTSLDALDELMACLQENEWQLSETERRYVFELLSSVRTVFQESSTLGNVDLIRRVHELVGVMLLLAETLNQNPETKAAAKKIREAVRRVVPYAAFGAKLTAGSIGVAADLGQIAGM